MDDILGEKCLIPICIFKADRGLVTSADADDTCDSPLWTKDPFSLLYDDMNRIVPSQSAIAELLLYPVCATNANTFEKREGGWGSAGSFPYEKILAGVRSNGIRPEQRRTCCIIDTHGTNEAVLGQWPWVEINGTRSRLACT